MSRVYLEYILDKASRLINNKHDPYLRSHFLAPIGIDVECTYKDLKDQVERLRNLYVDGRERKITYDSNLILFDLMEHFYFDNDYFFMEYIGINSLESYYRKTKELFEEIPETKNNLKQNRYYEIVIRNLILLISNSCIRTKKSKMFNVDMSLRGIGIMSRRQLTSLLRTKEYGIEDANVIAQYVKEQGGFPIKYTIYVNDPQKDTSIGRLLGIVPQIPTEENIGLADCTLSHLFYSVLLTALVFNMEVQ